jgi:hypothetical protein
MFNLTSSSLFLCMRVRAWDRFFVSESADDSSSWDSVSWDSLLRTSLGRDDSCSRDVDY